MSKVVAAVIATGGASAAVVAGGTYLVGQTPISADLSKFVGLDEFKEENGGDCGKYFSGLNLKGSSGTPIDTDTHKIGASHFGGSEDVQSCLVVNWERTDSSASENKWQGYFRWVGSFVKGNKGFIAFTTTKLSSTDNQLDLEGGIYFLNNSGGNGLVDKYKTLDSSKNISKSAFTTAFSKVGDSLTDVKNREYWGFMSAATDLDKVCKEDEKSSCTKETDTKKIFRGSWTGSKTNDGASAGTLLKGCKDFDSYFPNMYSSGEIALKDNLQSLSGAWRKEVLEEPSNTPNP